MVTNNVRVELEVDNVVEGIVLNIDNQSVIEPKELRRDSEIGRAHV